MKGKFSLLEQKIDIAFKDKKLLENVFVHRSYLNEHKQFSYPSNEKLEFLGDSVLSLITSLHLYKHYPAYEEGDYTDIKSAIVRTESLAVAASSLSLGKWLYLSNGEEQGGGRTNKNILADCFEALIGAIFIDKGFDSAYQFVKKYLFQAKLDAIIAKKLYLPGKSRLQEVAQSKYKVTPEYKVHSEKGPHHRRIFTVGVYINDKILAQASGRSKKEAEEQAASEALAVLNSKL